MKVALMRCEPCPREAARHAWMTRNCKRWDGRCLTKPPSMASAELRTLKRVGVLIERL